MAFPVSLSLWDTANMLRSLLVIEIVILVFVTYWPSLTMHNAVSAGATRDEVIDAAAIGVEFGGGPTFVVVREHLLPFLDEIAPNQ